MANNFIINWESLSGKALIEVLLTSVEFPRKSIKKLLSTEIWKKLFTVSVSVNKKYLTDSVSVNKNTSQIVVFQ